MALLLVTNFVVLLFGFKTLVVGLGLLSFATYVGLKTPEQLQRHARLRKLKDRHIAQYFAGGIVFTAFAAMLLTKAWFNSGEEKTELETGLTVGLALVVVLAMAAVFLFQITSRLRD